ncbi:uncharacterized protein LOC132751068 [Ruditapes philippinarum]|uniref:uncharacterized protein LOC132751068 n=1 Tax=Ruditapes philippinarum TaxID=129788 RepID=UPI00295BF152|nr:uncharacterized protein LOC132751068 [Ruditapes philippinarum]XP_060597162.1 uncharacterized protein LOC132751068 [Ruditapes philippinarum]
MSEDTQIKSLVEELKVLQNLKVNTSKGSGKRKLKRRRESLKNKKKQQAKEDEGECSAVNEDFAYSWHKCACGMQHPPIPHFTPPDGVRCTYYWQIADKFRFISLHRTLTTEIKFIQADEDQSGLIELPELKTLLRDIFGKDILSDRMLEKTFKEIDMDQSGTIDFFEVLTILYDLVQRAPSNLPVAVQKDYSKVCSIQ